MMNEQLAFRHREARFSKSPLARSRSPEKTKPVVMGKILQSASPRTNTFGFNADTG